MENQILWIFTVVLWALIQTDLLDARYASIPVSFVVYPWFPPGLPGLSVDLFTCISGSCLHLANIDVGHCSGLQDQHVLQLRLEISMREADSYSGGCLGAQPPPPWISEKYDFQGFFRVPTGAEPPRQKCTIE